MSIYHLPPDLESELAERMQTGKYDSADDILRDAFRALKSHESEVASIQQGIEDMNAGHVRSLVEFDREFQQSMKSASLNKQSTEKIC